MKPLEELSYAELMALFPIVLVPHRDEWREQYAREKARLLARLPGGDIFRLSHVGRTAIEGIWAKPTVDMVLEAADAAAENARVTLLELMGLEILPDGARQTVGGALALFVSVNLLLLLMGGLYLWATPANMLVAGAEQDVLETVLGGIFA